jgi:hypothetical protein
VTGLVVESHSLEEGSPLTLSLTLLLLVVPTVGIIIGRGWPWERYRCGIEKESKFA